MTRRGLAAALLALLLPGCASIPPAAIGAVAGAVTAAFRLDDDLVKLVLGPGALPPAKGKKTMATLLIGRTYPSKMSFTYQDGSPAPAPAGGSVSVDNPAVATATLSADGTDISIVAVGPGTANLSYTDGTVVAQPLALTVQPPVVSSAEIGIPGAAE